MTELVLLAEFASREEAKSEAVTIAATQGKSPTLRRSGAGWGLFVPQTVNIKVRPAPLTPNTVPVPVPRKKVPARKSRSSTSIVPARPQDPSSILPSSRATTRPCLQTKPSRKGTWSMTSAEAHQMAAELRHAYGRLSPDDAAAWLSRTTTRFGFVTVRRVRNLGGLALTVLEGTGDEIIGFVKAALEMRAADHVVARINRGSRKVADFATGIREKAAPIIAELKANPAEVAPDLLVVALSFYVAGGGFDGDGGIPDSDIALLGIEAHRSLFTHSIVAGAVVETALYSLVDFIAIAHKHLPQGHDRRLTLIHDRFERAAASGARGTSLGLAYHLGVDGLVQPGAYHGIPFDMSMEGHQAILTANAVAEGLDGKRKRTTKSRPQAVTNCKATSLSRAKPKERKVASIATGTLAALAALLLGFG